MATTRPHTDAGRCPLFAPDDPPAVRRRRLARGLALELGGFALLTLAAPLLLAAAAVVDLVRWAVQRKPWMSVRVVAIVWWVLFVELRGLVNVAGIWLLTGGPFARDTDTRRGRTYAAQVRWGAGHFTGIVRICRMRLEIDNPAAVGSGPTIVLSRHASIIDFGLPAHVVSRAHGIDLRYALKTELQALPSLDIGARWVPTYFVRRSSSDRRREIEAVGRLATALHGPRDGVLIYPEGTLFSAARLASLQARPDLGDDELREFAGRLRHVLPLRTGGPLAVIDTAPHAAVVICGHVGLDGVLGLRELWSGELVGRTLRVRFWRHEADAIPATRDARRTWLFECWETLDRWIGEQL
jgi:1-acyl-sn-glycerol-3-phosphate acyltransferase